MTKNDVDSESSVRNAQGELMRDRIATKTKIALEWGFLTSVEIASILNSVQDVFFQCSYLDPKEGQVTKTFYSGDRESELTYKGGMWKGLKMNFIEK